MKLAELICLETGYIRRDAETIADTRGAVAVAISVRKEGTELKYVVACYWHRLNMTADVQREQRGSQCAQTSDGSEGERGNSSSVDSVERMKIANRLGPEFSQTTDPSRWKNR